MTARASAASWLWSSALPCCSTARCASAAAAACSSAALEMVSAPRRASLAAPTASTAEIKIAWLSSPSRAISARTASKVAATVRPAAASASTIAAVVRRLSPISRTPTAIRSAATAMSRERVSATSAKARTSSATTAKPRPSAPARSASIAAFSASRLVCSARSATPSVISPMRAACRSSATTVSTLEACLRALLMTAFTEALTAAADSVSTACSASARWRETSARSRAAPNEVLMLVIAASDSCAAPAASSAPLAICDKARRSSSTAPAASVTPPLSSRVAALIRSEAVCRREAAWRADERLARGGTEAGAASAAPFRALARSASFVVFTSAMRTPDDQTQGEAHRVARPNLKRRRFGRPHAQAEAYRPRLGCARQDQMRPRATTRPPRPWTRT